MKKYLYIMALVVPCLLQAAVRGVGGDESRPSGFTPGFIPPSELQYKPTSGAVPYNPISSQQPVTSVPTKAALPMGKLPVLPPQMNNMME